MKNSDSHQQTHVSNSRSEQPFFGAESEQAFFAKERSRPEPFFKPAARPSTPIQAKLTVGAAGDRYEQEADRVASQMVDQINHPSVQQMSDHQAVQRLEEDEDLQAKPVQGRGEAEDENLQMQPISATIQRMETDEEDLQRAVEQDPARGGTASPDLKTSIQQARGGGQSIAEQVRKPMEQAFGADFSGVRVHTDAQSDQLNRSIQAKAFTTGQDVFFRQGAYQPESQGGQKLIAHELTHVMQQNGKTVQRSTEAHSNRINASPSDNVVQIEETERNQSFEVEQQKNLELSDRSSSIAIKHTPLSLLPTPLIQRTIHQYEDGDWCIVQPGTTGNKQPEEPFEEGEYFNDVTGARGDSLDSVSAGLVDYMMMTGSIKDIMQTNDEWIDVADALGAEAANRLRLENEGKEKKQEDDYVLYAGFFRLRWVNGKTKISFLSRIANEDLFNKAVSFVFNFMRANGQLGYIEQQDWYRNGAACVLVDLNFYYKRLMGDEGLDLHKDTGGDNLFVNLIFNNPDETPGTEWTQDTEGATEYKKAQMERLMPKEMLDAISKAKTTLKEGTGAGGGEQIEGGILPSYGYVSWVDELILHSTPSLANRMSYETLAQALEFEDAASFIQALLEQKGTSRQTYEVMVILSEAEGTIMHGLREYLKEEGKEFTHTYWIDLYQALYKKATSEEEVNSEEEAESEKAKSKQVKAQLIDNIKNYDWANEKFTGSTVNEIATEGSVGTVNENLPSGTKGRPRANSKSEVLKKVKTAAAAQEQRSFLRSWVRVVKNENWAAVLKNVTATAQEDLVKEQVLKSRIESGEESKEQPTSEQEKQSDEESGGQPAPEQEKQSDEDNE